MGSQRMTALTQSRRAQNAGGAGVFMDIYCVVTGLNLSSGPIRDTLRQIQNGTRHAWHNRSSEKCVISVVIVGERKP
jgi:hypothetical protein